jgi:hypothetical protein
VQQHGQCERNLKKKLNSQRSTLSDIIQTIKQLGWDDEGLQAVAS